MLPLKMIGLTTPARGRILAVFKTKIALETPWDETSRVRHWS